MNLKSYTKGDSHIQAYFLDSINLFGVLGSEQGKFGFVAGRTYILPSEIAIELNKLAFCVVQEQIK